MSHRTHHLGDQGKGVQSLQWLLHDNRFGESFLGPHHVDGNFGAQTAAAVREAKHFLGYPKPRVSASAGEQLRSYLTDERLPHDYAVRRGTRLFHEMMHGRHEKMIRGAVRQVGYVEGANNHTKFGEWYHLDFNPWCAMFQSYEAWRAGLEFHYASCPQVVSDARAKRNGLSVCGPKRGALALYDWEGDGVADHIGLILGVKGGTIHTVEGNTSPADFSNGGMVMLRTRTMAQVQTCVWIGKQR